jgi:hypothetical protein
VREKLINGGSFFYSWENGLGTNFLSLISYYAASPLNWLSVFFDDDHVRDAMTFILSCKIGFAGAFFSTFLRYTYKRKDFSICMFIFFLLFNFFMFRFNMSFLNFFFLIFLFFLFLFGFNFLFYGYFFFFWFCFYINFIINFLFIFIISFINIIIDISWFI